jgi:hypothetical protein
LLNKGVGANALIFKGVGANALIFKGVGASAATAEVHRKIYIEKKIPE